MNQITKEQINLNNMLLEICKKEKVNYLEIKTIIKGGANPLGLTNEYEIVYTDLIKSRELDKDDDKTLYNITKTFIKEGMEIKKTNLPFDCDNTLINPFWHLRFLSPVKAISILSLLIDETTEIELIDDFIDSYTFDFSPIEDDFHYLAGIARELLYLASYKFILEKSKNLKSFVEVDDNEYDLSNFRNPFNYYIMFNTNKETECAKEVKVYEKKTDKLVWKFDFISHLKY